MHHYPRHIGDYQKDTADLSLAEHGAYSLLMDHYYAHEQPLPADRDRIYRICGATTKGDKAAVDHVVSRYFATTVTGCTNKRCDVVIAEYRGKVNIARENGRRGGRPPKPPETTTDGKPTEKPDGFSVGSENRGFENQRRKLTNNHKPITSNQENTNAPPTPTGEPPDGGGGVAVQLPEIALEWNSVSGVTAVREMTEKRRTQLRARLKNPVWVASWREAMQRVAASSFCRGGGDKGWVADLDWFLRPDTVTKILEGRYDDRDGSGVDLFAGLRASSAKARQMEGGVVSDA